jgi:hypothetical protein
MSSFKLQDNNVYIYVNKMLMDIGNTSISELETKTQNISSSTVAGATILTGTINGIDLVALAAKTQNLTSSTNIGSTFTTDQTVFTEDQELITKKYVDTSAAELETKTQNISSSTVAGATILTGTINGVDLVALDAKTQNLTSSTNIGSTFTTDQTVFTEDQELITKKYVDTSAAELETKTQNFTSSPSYTNIAGVVNLSGVLFDGSNLTAVYTPIVNALAFSANNAEVLRLGQTLIDIKTKLNINSNDIIDVGSISVNNIDITGSTGIGDFGYRQLRISHPTDITSGWNLGCQKEASSLYDNDLYFECGYSDGSYRNAGRIGDLDSNTQMNFTGQHRCMPMFDYNEDMIGRIVETTGSYMNMIKKGGECSHKSCITINDSLPMVVMASTANSQKVFGVISSSEDNSDKRQTTTGNFVSMYDKVQGDKRLFINGLGEGGIWVSNIEGNLINGDYISSAGIVSGIQGYGKKQSDEFYKNITVAKITMDCDFNPVDEDIKIYDSFDENTQEIVWRYVLNDDGTRTQQPKYDCVTLSDGSKVAFVGCIYLCS